MLSNIKYLWDSSYTAQQFVVGLNPTKDKYEIFVVHVSADASASKIFVMQGRGTNISRPAPVTPRSGRRVTLQGCPSPFL